MNKSTSIVVWSGNLSNGEKNGDCVNLENLCTNTKVDLAISY